jgi:hypothetical protein
MTDLVNPVVGVVATVSVAGSMVVRVASAPAVAAATASFAAAMRGTTDSDSSRSGHSNTSGLQDHSVPLGFESHDNVYMGSAQYLSTSSVRYDGSGSEERTCFLTSETQIILHSDQERRLFQQLKDREFAHTKVVPTMKLV